MGSEAKALIRQWFDEVWDKKDFSAIDRLMHPRVVIHGLGEGGPTPGALGHFKEFHAVFCAAFPDLRIKVHDLIEDGDKIAWRMSFHGTHAGDALGIPASMRQVSVGAIGISRVSNGKIVEGWNEFDRYGMFQQIGGV